MIPEPVIALAAGLNGGDPEFSWERVAAVVQEMGFGAYSPDALVAAVDGWLLAKGRNRWDLCAAVRASRLPVRNINVSIGFKDAVGTKDGWTMAVTRHPDGGKPDLARIKAPGSPTAAASRIDYRSLLAMSDDYDETDLNPAAHYRQTHTQEETERAFPPPVDYRLLLVKYIRHVWMETGLDTEGLKAFLAESERQMAAGAGITDTEWAELQRLASEVPR